MPFAVIFDMDGVIADTNPTHLVSWKEYLLENNIEATDSDLIVNMFGKSNTYILEYFFKRKMEREEVERRQWEKEGLFRKMYEPIVKPLNGLLIFIDDLKANGVKTGIATSAPVQNLDMMLRKVDLRSKMESLLSWEDVVNHKPAPDVYLQSAKNVGVPIENCVVFEDSTSGIQAGLAAGAKVVGVLTSHQPHELPPCHAYIENYEAVDYAFITNLFREN